MPTQTQEDLDVLAALTRLNVHPAAILHWFLLRQEPTSNVFADAVEVALLNLRLRLGLDRTPAVGRDSHHNA